MCVQHKKFQQLSLSEEGIYYATEGNREFKVT